MLTLLLAALVASPAQVTTVTRAAPKEPPAERSAQVYAEADPDVVLRGRSVKLVVKGRDTVSLKTLQVSPSSGVTLRSIKPLPSQADGSAAVSVELQVDATADPGERALLLTVAPRISTSAASRPGGDSIAKAMDALLAAVIRDQTTASEAGTLYINSHAISITGVVVGQGEPREVRVTVTDEAGDVESTAPISIPAAPSAGTTTLPLSAELIVSEARCGQEVFDGILEDAMVRETRAGSVVLGATLSSIPVQGAGACELRVRVRDRAGNISPWFMTRLALH